MHITFQLKKESINNLITACDRYLTYIKHSTRHCESYHDLAVCIRTCTAIDRVAMLPRANIIPRCPDFAFWYAIVCRTRHTVNTRKCHLATSGFGLVATYMRPTSTNGMIFSRSFWWFLEKTAKWLCKRDCCVKSL